MDELEQATDMTAYAVADEARRQCASGYSEDNAFRALVLLHALALRVYDLEHELASLREELKL